VGSKTLHHQNPPVLNWRCWLMQVDLCFGCKTVAVVVMQYTHLTAMQLALSTWLKVHSLHTVVFAGNLLRVVCLAGLV